MMTSATRFSSKPHCLGVPARLTSWSSPHRVLDQHISRTSHVKSMAGAAFKERIGFATQTIGVSGKPIYQPGERIDSSEVPQGYGGSVPRVPGRRITGLL